MERPSLWRCEPFVDMIGCCAGEGEGGIGVFTLFFSILCCTHILVILLDGRDLARWAGQLNFLFLAGNKQ